MTTSPGRTAGQPPNPAKICRWSARSGSATAPTTGAGEPGIACTGAGEPGTAAFHGGVGPAGDQGAAGSGDPAASINGAAAGRGCGPRNQAMPAPGVSGSGAAPAGAGGPEAPARDVSGLAFTVQTLERWNQDGSPYLRSVDDGSACGRPFQDAAALLVDPEDEPDDADPVLAEPDDDLDESPEDDDADSLFFSPEPFGDPFGDEPLDAFAFSRLSVR